MPEKLYKISTSLSFQRYRQRPGITNVIEKKYVFCILHHNLGSEVGSLVYKLGVGTPREAVGKFNGDVMRAPELPPVVIPVGYRGRRWQSSCVKRAYVYECANIL